MNLSPQDLEDFHKAHQSNDPELQKKMAEKFKDQVTKEMKTATAKNLDLASAALSVAASVLKDPDSISVLSVMQAAIKEAKTRVKDKNVQDALVLGNVLLDGYQDRDLPTIKRSLGSMLTRLAGTPQAGDASKYLKLMIDAAVTENTVPKALLKFSQGLIKTEAPKNTVEGRLASTLFGFLFQEARRLMQQ